MKLTKFAGNPILSPEPGHPWESFVTTNPGAVHDPRTGKVLLLYRAAGDDEQHFVRFGLAESTDGFHFTRVSDEPVFGPTADGFDAGCVEDRDVYLFPETIGGKYWMIQRPMQWAGEGYGTPHPAMWINSSDDLLHWDSSTSRLLAKAEYDWEVKIGGNTPPMRTDLGWLTLYHGKGPDEYYRLGALVLDLEDPTIVRYRTRDWLLEPEQPYETQGCYEGGGVVFPCGKVVLGDTLFVYYGGADKYVGVATCSFSELRADLKHQPFHHG